MSIAEEPIQGRIVWTPPEGTTRLDRFRERINAEHGVALEDYAQLHKWSVESLAPFWQAVWDEIGVVASAPASEVAANVSSRCAPATRRPTASTSGTASTKWAAAGPTIRRPMAAKMRW